MCALAVRNHFEYHDLRSGPEALHSGFEDRRAHQVKSCIPAGGPQQGSPRSVLPRIPLEPGIIETALGFSRRSIGSLANNMRGGPASGKCPRHEAHSHCSIAHAKPPLNVFLGLVLLLVSLLLLLALATYHPSDPSLNTATDLAPRRAQLDRPLRRLPQRSAAAVPGSDRLSAAPVAGRHRLDLDALAPQRLALAALDRHSAGARLCARRLWPAALALALAALLPVEGVVGRLMAGLLVTTSTFRAPGWWPACWPPRASTLPPPSASGPSRKASRIAGCTSQPGTTAGATGAKSALN